MLVKGTFRDNHVFEYLPAESRHMPTDWNIRDLIDLEYFLGTEKRELTEPPDAGGGEFDRKVYRSYAETHPAPHSRRDLIRFWLDRRRNLETGQGKRDALLPGTVYAETIDLLRIILAFMALVSGILLTWNLLSYQGREPINVFTCLWVLVVPQVLLLLTLLLFALFRNARIFRSLIFFYPVMTALARRLFHRVGRIMETRLSADRKDRFRSAVGLLGQTRTVYGTVFIWPVFLTLQLFAICYNIGILGALLLRVMITDLAFGWESTLQPAPETVYRIVNEIAFPWSWLLSPPLSHPTLAQIAGTKMVLKEGIYHLSTRDLVAWWPFLAFAVMFYGLVPRLITFTAGWIAERRALKTLDFSHAACDRLVQRMQTPRLATESRPYTEPVPPAPSPERVFAADSTEANAGSMLTPAILMIPEELLGLFHPKEAAVRIRTTLAINTVETLPAAFDPDSDGRRLAEAMKATRSEVPIRVVILQEAWQPPIKETLSWLRSIRDAAGKTSGIVIALVGKPAAGNVFTPPAETDRIVWERGVQAMGDPFMRVEPLGTMH